MFLFKSNLIEEDAHLFSQPDRHPPVFSSVRQTSSGASSAVALGRSRRGSGPSVPAHRVEAPPSRRSSSYLQRKTTVLRPSGQLPAFAAEEKTQNFEHLCRSRRRLPSYDSRTNRAIPQKILSRKLREHGAVDEGAAVEVLLYQPALQPNRRETCPCNVKPEHAKPVGFGRAAWRAS